MIYGTYAVLSQHWLPCCVLAYVWGILFYNNMLRKEESFSKKEGWDEYCRQSWMFFPRIFGPTVRLGSPGAEGQQQQRSEPKRD